MPVARMLGPVTILSDADIRRYLAKGEVQIAPYDEAHLTPNGYDVTIEEVLIPASNVRTTTGVAKIPPTTRFAVSTRESVRLGRHVAGQIWLRTTWARRGVIAVRDDRCRVFRHPDIRRLERELRLARVAHRGPVRSDRVRDSRVPVLGNVREAVRDVSGTAGRHPRSTVTSKPTWCWVGEYARTR